ncbi:MAG: DEAD/DEAH box helicase, partial [Burkholderiaceae bacterium]|nr:DEAD/DEAH box helicase [Burkholderiaceae bacterium]
MFDPETVKLIENAPSLEGLNLGTLPKEFTRIFASIVASRMRLRDAASTAPIGEKINSRSSQEIPDDIRKEMVFLSELANTQEALISVSPDRANRRSAAFVAGTAHFVLLQAKNLLEDSKIDSELGINSIPSEVSATILFLIAGSSADASQMAKEITIQTESPNLRDGSRQKLLLDIRRFAQGKLKEITDPGPFFFKENSTAPAEIACAALYHSINRVLHKFALVMLGDVVSENLASEFSEIAALTSMSQSTQNGFSFYSIFSGPRHLAVLLSVLAKEFPEGSVANIPTPSGCDPLRWKAGVSEIARKRPYLWQNHLDAVMNGYLEVGVSSAISFPTGAGKSTLSELKILSAISANTKVIFLAPTLALVDQTARALDEAFPNANIEQEHASDDPFGFDKDTLPAITVMTPERCLTLMGFEPTLFSRVGLIVFDECHLLHTSDVTKGTRAVDAMLCVINAITLAPETDMLLLSAMMSNPDEIAGWIKSITGRRCLSLSMNWKPTRQVRGCLVYAEREINSLKQLASEKNLEGKTANPTKKFQDTLLAYPQGFFGLKIKWDTLARQDYSLMHLLNTPVALSLNKYWQLTPNSNQIASAIAAAAVGTSAHPLKTLVFCQTTVNANSAAKYARERLGRSSVLLTSHETDLYNAALEEFGNRNALHVEISDDGLYSVSSALPHHSKLISFERHLHESLYKRPDGIHVMAATSTLAQGMNLPSQVVIIAGDSRFDKEANQLERLEAHELLNAAGRAGRAGENSYGFVLVIPSKVVHFSNAKNLIHNHWTELRGIFAQSDQCLTIEDPLEVLLDKIHMSGTASGKAAEYLLRRLPVAIEDTQDVDDPARMLLAKSFNVYKRRQAGDDNWISSRIETAINARRALGGPLTAVDWADRLGAKFGVEPATLRSLHRHFQTTPNEDTIPGWIDWLFQWLRIDVSLFPNMVREDGLETLFGKPYKDLPDTQTKGMYALDRIRPLLISWITGGTLHDIECIFGTGAEKTGKCDNARDFVLRVVPDIAYIASLPELVRRETEDLGGASLTFSRLSACIRDGLDTIEKLAL